MTPLNIYNVRYVKIQSNKSGDFCLRVELCGEGKGPIKFYSSTSGSI